ncbi:MAG TPA: hypothetical protein VGO25_14675 [Rhodanobacteraceae bacterium]|nr:hypothetical protein [Rhodanobacteraceae bacterium]
MFRWSFRSRARHPLGRLLATVAGAVALLILLVFGLFAAAALIVGGAVFLLVKGLRASQNAPQTNPAPAPAPDNVIEGEFTVTRDVHARHQAAR